ncbi:MAG: hypothetical protein JWL83_1804 [Actinomycetia bacterium]|nr:hypothetical protein [Actinomycetes bacterium]
MDRVALDQLFRDAAAAYRADSDETWVIFDEAVKADAVAVGEAAIPLVSSPDAVERVVAIWALRQACNICEDTREPSFVPLASRVGVEDDVDACRCFAQALGAVADARAVAPLVALSHHTDADVRQHVATSLSAALLEQPAQAGIDALLRLMTDGDNDVRDWATFAIGQQLNVDGIAIRQALVARLGDTFDDAREEAMVGLARRRDRRALPAVIEALRGDAGRLAFAAAEYLADPVLVPLLELHDSAEVDAALQRCDPRRRASWDERVEEFASVLQARLDIDFTGAAAAVGCELCETETWLRIEAVGASEWCVDVLLELDDPTSAADRIIHQLTQHALRRADTP